MVDVDHKLTRTFGGKGSVTKFADVGLSFRDVLAKDIRDLRSKFGPKYNSGIRDLLDHYYTNQHGLMRKRQIGCR